MEKTFVYYAFISYKREDEKWAKWLQHKLEYYKIPLSVRKNNSDIPEQVRPVFKDTTDLSGGVLEKAINEALESSKYLIVICSPRAAQSPWVCKEVQRFIDLGREEFVIPFIIDGTPNSDDANECFPLALKSLVGSRELLGININENGREAAVVKVVARMFGIQFDTLWQRYRKAEKRKRTIITITLLSLFILAISIAIIINNLRIQANESKKVAVEAKEQAISLQVKAENERDGMLLAQSRAVAKCADELIESGDILLALQLLLEVVPSEENPRPYSQEAERSLRTALLKYYSGEYKSIVNIELNDYTNPVPVFNTKGDFFTLPNATNGIDLYRTADGVKVKQIDLGQREVHAWCFTEDDKSLIAEGNDSFYKIDIPTGKLSIIHVKDRKKYTYEDEMNIVKGFNLGGGKQNILVPLLLKCHKMENMAISVSNDLKRIIYNKNPDPFEQSVYLYNVDTGREIKIFNIKSEDNSFDFIVNAAFSPDNSEYAYITGNGEVFRATLNAPLDKITTAYTQEFSGGIYNRIGYQSSGRIYAYSSRWEMTVPRFYEIKNNILESRLQVNSEIGYQNIVMHPSNDNIFIASLRGQYQILLKSTDSPFFTKIEKTEIPPQGTDCLNINQEGQYDFGNCRLEYKQSAISVYDSKNQLVWSQGDCSDIRVSPDKKLLLYNVFISPNDYSVIKYLSTGQDYLGDFYSIHDKRYEMQQAWFSSNNHIIIGDSYSDFYYDFLLPDNKQMIEMAKELTKGRTLTEQDKKRFFLL